MTIFKTNYKIYLAFLHDLAFTFMAFILSIALRFSLTNYNFLTKIPNLGLKVLVVLLVQQFLFITFGLYQGLWRFSSTHDLKQLIKASFLSALTSYIIISISFEENGIPRTSIFLYFCLSILFCGGGRFLYRLFKESKYTNDGARTLIVGAGNAAEQIIRDSKRQFDNSFEIVGLVDDTKDKQRRTIHGIKVLGDTYEIPRIVKEKNVKQVFIAIPSASSSDIRRIVTICNEVSGITVKTLPSVQDIIDGKVSVSSLRKVNPEDLLGRDPVSLDMDAIGKMITDKNILISGAGGSIGSELSKQILKFQPKNLLLLDNSEFHIYELERKIKALGHKNTNIHTIVADIRNKERLDYIFNNNDIDTVYHAAALKQVPLMESDPTESIETNIFGTKNLANVAIENHVKRFVMISTDKAVNPTNVMGTTKRIAEMICQDLSSTKTKFTAVRFGNVLGSNGSVIPLFEEQIKNGGPVTVTHKDITRYFMSISEAAQLVLQAGSMGKGGEIFVLDMGEPIKIYEFAKQMIKLSGFEPLKDIDIKIVGLRAGEKLYEELLADEENTMETPHPSVRVACARKVADNLSDYLNELKNNLYNMNKKEIKLLLKECVVEYSPDLKEEISSEYRIQ